MKTYVSGYYSDITGRWRYLAPLLMEVNVEVNYRLL